MIDTAPTGLYVIRRSDHHVLLENQRAQQWHDSSRLMNLLTSRTEPGHADLEIDGRHLQSPSCPLVTRARTPGCVPCMM